MELQLNYKIYGQTESTELNQPTLMIGSLPSNQIIIAGQGVDPIHALIEQLEDGTWRVTDLGSESGIYLNGTKIDVEKSLKVGDVIKIGEVELTLVEKEAPVAAPPPIPAVPPAPELSKTVVSSSDEATAYTPRSSSSSASSSSKSSSSSSAADRDRGDKLFSPRQARPEGDVLEVVAYWDDTVLEVEHFESGQGKESKVRIGHPPQDQFLSAGPKDLKNYALAKATSGGYMIKLIEGMKGRLRKSGKVEKVEGGKHKLSRRDIAHVKYGPISYFLLYVRPPQVELAKSSKKDPVFMALMSVGLAVFFLLSTIAIVGTPNKDKDKEDDVWMTLMVAKEAKPIKEERKKPKKPPVKVVKTPPPKPKPPIPKPTPPKPKKVQVVKKIEKPKKVYKQKNKVNTKLNVKTGKPKTPKKAPTAGMAKKSDKPDFKRAGRKIAGVKQGPSGGARGGGNARSGAPRKGKSRASVMGVEGVKNNRVSGVNLSKLGLGAGKVFNKSGPGAIQTNFKSSAGGAGGGSGSARRNLGMGGGLGTGRSLGLGGSSAGLNNFGSGSGGLLSGQGGKGGLGGFGGGRGTGGRRPVAVSVGSGGAPGVSGGLTTEEIQQVISANLNQIRNCYEQVLQRSPNKSGKMKVNFVVNANGRVASARVVSDSVGDARMGSCVTSRIKRWAFPRPKGGQKVDVSYPFVFNPS